MQKRIFAILLVAAVVAMATPASQAKCFMMSRNGSGTSESYVGTENFGGVPLGSATNEIKFEIDFKYPTALGSTYAYTSSGTARYQNRCDGVLLHEGVGCTASAGYVAVSPIGYSTSGAVLGTLSGAWVGLNMATIYVDAGSGNTKDTNPRGIYLASQDNSLARTSYRYAGLAAFVETPKRPCYTADDIANGKDLNSVLVPSTETAPTPLTWRMVTTRPLPNQVGPQPIFYNGVMQTTKQVVDMTSRTLATTLGGGDQSAHDSYTNNSATTVYDHKWHTMSVEISHLTPGDENTSPTAKLSVDGVVLINDYLSGAEYKALNSLSEMEKGLGTATKTTYKSAWNTGRNFVLSSDSTMDSNWDWTIPNAMAVRWDNLNINGAPLEQFSLDQTYYRYAHTPLSNYVEAYRPTGHAPSIQKSYSDFFYIDVTDNSPFEKTLGARDWTIY
jgi:hypothetical protein